MMEFLKCYAAVLIAYGSMELANWIYRTMEDQRKDADEFAARNRNRLNKVIASYEKARNEAEAERDKNRKDREEGICSVCGNHQNPKP